MDPEGQFAFLVGAIIAAAVDFGVQAYQNNWNVRDVNLAQVGVSAAIGATGVGAASVVTNLIKSAGLSGARAVAASVGGNAVGGAVVGTWGQAVENVIEGDPITQDLGSAGRIGAVSGIVGASIGSASKGVLGKSQNLKRNRNYSKASTASKRLADGGSVDNSSHVEKVANSMTGVSEGIGQTAGSATEAAAQNEMPDYTPDVSKTGRRNQRN